MKSLREELEQAMDGQSVFSDGNGVYYLADAIDTLEEAVDTGVDHKKMREQVWNAISSLTPSILQSPGLSDENYGKIVKLFWITNFDNTVARLQDIDDESIKANTKQIADWLLYILDI